MPYQRKDSPIWWASYLDASGKRVRRTTGTTDRKEAQVLEAKWRSEVHQMKHWGAPVTYTFEDLMLAYLPARQGEIDLERVAGAIKNLKRIFSGRELAKLKRADISSFITMRRGEGVSPATVNRDLDVFSAAINYAIKRWDWEIPNPVMGMSLKEPEGRLRYISRAEADALIKEAEKQSRSPHLPDFIRLALNTGCRRGEMLNLEWSRVDLQSNTFHMEGVHTKSRKRRSVPLNQEARVALLNRAAFRDTYCPDSPWVFAHKNGKRIQELHTGFRTACNNVGIRDFRIHDLRHTCASWLVSAGVPLPEVRDLLGHASVEMTERYAHLAPENLRTAVGVLDRMSRFGHAGSVEQNSPSQLLDCSGRGERI